MPPADSSDLAQTLVATKPIVDTNAPTLVAAAPSFTEAALDLPSPGPFRYATRAVLGEGGMGRVHLCHDGLIGREVAVKMMLPELEQKADVRARFLREARVQGQLEHPAIVPVHEIGVSPEGSTYFTMKRVRGVTLAFVIEALAAGDPEASARFSLRRLLSAFVSVCLAMDFAHGRGVLHRDLKPGNIMLGAHGEVSVLDWGIAKAGAEADDAGPQSQRPVDTGENQSLGGARTEAGALLGTPGYMAPECVLGEPASVQSDVFSLGAILFEILAQEPLVPRAASPGMFVATVAKLDAQLSRRCPGREIAPELTAICVRATAREPANRFASARDLSEAVERFLEGDRDLARRRELSEARAEAAEALLGEASPGRATEEIRSRAMRELGHALALDPDNARARASLVRVLTEPPAETPAEVRDAIAAAEQRQLRLGSEIGGVVALVWFLFLPLFYWAGIQDWTVAALVLAPIGASAVMSRYNARRSSVSVPVQYLTYLCATFAIASTSRIFGPFIMLPTLAATYAVNLQVHPRRTPRRVVLALCCVAVLAPVLLEIAGVLPPTVTIREGAIVIRTLGTVRAGPVIAILSLVSLAMTLSASLFITRMRDALSRAEQSLLVHAWHVQRMMPEGLPTRLGGAQEGREAEG